MQVSNLDIRDGGIYEFKCDKGHEYVTFIQNEQFEILFDIGALALLDGYSRESVSSFAAALERFYEYCIKVFLIKNKISYEKFNLTWKMVSNSSERQMGAFYILYLNEFKESPPKIPDPMVSFRNKVIHKGYIPKYNEVVSYATALYDHIIYISKSLRAKYQDYIPEVYFQRMNNIKRDKDKEYAFPQSVRTIIDFALADELFGTKTFEESLQDARDRIGWQYFK